MGGVEVCWDVRAVNVCGDVRDVGVLGYQGCGSMWRFDERASARGCEGCRMSVWLCEGM